MADGLAKSQDNLLYQSILGECGGNETLAKRLYEAEKSRWQTGYSLRPGRGRRNGPGGPGPAHRPAGGRFPGAEGRIPRHTEFGDLPRAVVETAVNRNISLFDAYLRFQHSEKRRPPRPKPPAKPRRKPPPAPWAAGTEEDTDPAVDAMLAGIWSGR